MKKILPLLFILCSTNAFSQILGYPGATWIFEDWVGGDYSLWTYEGDTLLEGESVRYVKQQNKNRYSDIFGHFTKNHFYKENNDTIWELINGSWLEVCNLSLQAGDQVPSPLYLANQGVNVHTPCYDETVAAIPATVHLSSINFETGIPLRFVLLRFATEINGTDTAYAELGYQERMLLYYYSLVPYLYYFSPGCPTESAMHLSCYFDNDIQPNGPCQELLAQFNTMNIPSHTSANGICAYPNPVQDYITIDLGIQSQGNWRWQLMSADGQVLMAGKPSTAPIDITVLPSGIYFLSCTEGSKVFREKIIKE